jgi:hypothetical protein
LPLIDLLAVRRTAGDVAGSVVVGSAVVDGVAVGDGEPALAVEVGPLLGDAVRSSP